MKIYSVNKDGSFCREFRRLLSLGRLTNIQKIYDFELDEIVMVGKIQPQDRRHECLHFLKI